MIEEQGIVLCRTATGAIVETQPSGGCGTCMASSGCGTAVLQKFLGKRQPNCVEAVASFPVEPGDRVVVGLDDGALLRTAAIVYGLPLVGLFAGALACSWIQGLHGGVADWPVVAGAALGLAAAISAARHFSSRMAYSPRYQSYIVRKAGDPVTAPVMDRQMINRGG